MFTAEPLYLPKHNSLTRKTEQGDFLPCFVRDAAGRFVWSPSGIDITKLFPVDSILVSITANDDSRAGVSSPASSLADAINISLNSKREWLRKAISSIYPNGKVMSSNFIYFPIKTLAVHKREDILSIIRSLDNVSLDKELVAQTVESLAQVGSYQIPTLSKFNEHYHEFTGDDAKHATNNKRIKIVQSGWVYNGLVIRKSSIELLN